MAESFCWAESRSSDTAAWSLKPGPDRSGTVGGRLQRLPGWSVNTEADRNVVIMFRSLCRRFVVDLFYWMRLLPRGGVSVSFCPG